MIVQFDLSRYIMKVFTTMEESRSRKTKKATNVKIHQCKYQIEYMDPNVLYKNDMDNLGPG